MSANPPPLPRVKGRLPFAQKPRTPGGGALKRGSILLYGALVIVLIGVAFYMGWYENRPLTSPYVVAPIVGAFWFALRLFMSLAPRA
ncbi:MAG: hypothetical protein NW206_16615 [Hyphomonadaceae bacterium]|nr:hypothetical protein [Hyphomonadaceae bacterium]